MTAVRVQCHLYQCCRASGQLRTPGPEEVGAANLGAGVTVTRAERRGYILDSLTTIALQCPPPSPSPFPSLTPSTTIPWPTAPSQATLAPSIPPHTPAISLAPPSPGARAPSPAGSSPAPLPATSSSKPPFSCLVRFSDLPTGMAKSNTPDHRRQ